jgi:hypothetical protein
MLAISVSANELGDELSDTKVARQSVTDEFEQLFVSVTDQLSNRQINTSMIPSPTMHF